MSTSAPTTISIFPDAEEPIRAELFSIERLEQHARSLAAAQTVGPQPSQGRKLTPRVRENGRVLLDCYQALARAIQQEHAITPAAEWLVDNFHIVDEQLREIRDDLPPGFYRRLPKLASGHLEGYPRALGVAWAFIAHTDSQIEPEVLRRFVKAYQEVQPLTIGELWALGITVRVVLVENLRRLAERIVQSRIARQEADTLADNLLGANNQAPTTPRAALSRFEKTPLATAFAVELLQRLRDLSPSVRPILAWLDERLKAQNTTADEIVRAEHQEQAAMNVTVRNIITSMRFLSVFDWQTFFENISLVDETLRENTNFAEGDFATRDSYRHAIEDLSRRSKYSELEVAERVVRRVKEARTATQNGSGVREGRLADPGYYLISTGRFEFEREIEFRQPWRLRLMRRYMRTAVPGYLGTIAVVTALILALPLLHERTAGAGAIWLILLGLLAAVPASDLAIALINRMATEWLGPRKLPRLDMKDGVPEHLRTIVAIPTLLTNEHDVDELVEQIEVHYLANPSGYMHFALLSDWIDAPQETLPSDNGLLAAAVNSIARLNKQYGPAPDGGNRFLLYHRKRVWNASEGKWMGWERKRGKLHELNLLLRGSKNTTFLAGEGQSLDFPPDVRHVITLDSDTRLPRGAAYDLVGTMAHPLNRPEFSADLARVVEGYGIVQPRITPCLPSNDGGSFFQRIFSGPSGMDPYASAVSDVYHDLFQEGSYTGKGIYDIDVFEAALAHKTPENALLSHDLFEGTFARTALVSDIELFDEFPAHYESAAARQHRWVRGDWQLLPWIFRLSGKKPTDHDRLDISAINRWKMIDNLRRSLSAPAAFLTLIAGWIIPAASPWMWTRFILATITIPALLPFMMSANPRRGISKRSYIRSLLMDLTLSASQIGLAITFLAYQAWLMSDAILRTLYRLFISRKHLLEWVTAAQTKRAVDLKLPGVYRRMAGGVLLTAGATVILALGRHQALIAGAPFVVLWAAAPAVARWISIPPRLTKIKPLSGPEVETLRSISRRTWHFFETFVTPADNNLPPDNFQEDPRPVIAHRTSPTNLGLYLLSVLAANDFGWIGVIETIERLEATLASMAKLERYRGHFYNWYGTADLQPLDPKYISSVDSGNLAGHLLAVANGCRSLMEAGIGTHLPMGAQDSIGQLRKALVQVGDTKRAYTVTYKQLTRAVDHLAASLEGPLATSAGHAAQLVALADSANTMDDIAQTLAQERGEALDSEVRVWAEATKSCVESHLRDAQVLTPRAPLDPGNVPGKAGQHSAYALAHAALEPFFRTIPTLADAPGRFGQALRALEGLRARRLHESAADPEITGGIEAYEQSIWRAEAQAAALVRRLSAIVETAESMFHAMDFSFLFDKMRKLLSIGYRVADGSLDPSCYDLLASEARLMSFVAIAKGDVPPAHWFRLGRALTPVGRGSALISWSGSMFEYLMPVLVMHSPVGSALNHTYDLIVRRQIAYGAERHVPWGISESAYNARDTNFTYQYTSFGVPGLGLKRGLSEDLVIAPYATGLAAMIAPDAAVQNFGRLADEGASGKYGYYEALDYTKTRLPEGKKVAVVRAYLAHHEGMTLVALANVLHDGVMRARFHAEPIVQATELLLQERTPRDVLVTRPHAEEVSAAAYVRELVPPVVRRFTTPHDAIPRTQLLSNGRYSVMLTAAGSGYSRWRDIAVTRWREDATRDCWGSYIYLRDAQTNQVWSAGYQPVRAEPEAYEALFYEDRGEIIRRDRSITTRLDVVVSSEDDAEMRRVSITNRSTRVRVIEVTSYFEVCLTPQATDAAHPAFSNLFVQTEFAPQFGALLATRRVQSDKDTPVWVAHVSAVKGEIVGELQFETDRARFLGRGRGMRNPIAIVNGSSPFSETTGSVLDPMMSLRRTVSVPPGATAQIIFSTMIAPDRESALNLADKYRDARTFERILTLAWTQAQVQLRHLDITPDEAHLFQRLANAVLYSDPSLRPSSDVLGRTTLDLGSLWGQGISGDLPIVLALIEGDEDIDLIQRLLRAHEYWRTKQLSVDVVIVNDKLPSYGQDLQGTLAALVRGSELRLSSETGSAEGKIFLLRGDLMPAQTRLTLQAAARAVLFTRRGSLFEQVARLQRAEPAPAAVPPERPFEKHADAPVVPPKLDFFNGLGGFAESGREYVAVFGEGAHTPQPWINVIANPSFGFIVSESGSGHTWSLNSRENQLTPWSNDPVSDPPGEAIYIRDENSGEIWTPTALPIYEENAIYIAHHGQGYSRFEHSSHGISHDLLQFVPSDDPIKISRLTLQNNSGRARRLSVTAYAEWVFGNSRSGSAPFVITEIDPQTRAIFAHSAWTGEFAGRIAFADMCGRQTCWTGDRKEFLGRNGGFDRPAALARGTVLSGKVGAGLDPCAALQTSVELRPGARAEITFFLGQEENTEKARGLLNRYRAIDVTDALKKVTRYWDGVLGAIQVTTPDPSMDILLNRWLLYQTLSCRIWARAALYQVSGAYGFRDQLQDVMALGVAERRVAREHLLRAAARQFVEGDVQHWWHPPSGRGVRTRISDDLLWLPYAVIHFMESTGDTSVLDEVVPFLDGAVLAEGQKESYFEPKVSETRATLFEHCARALDRSLAVGSHGLPLMGTGDWNDGMNRVGENGKGESVWLGWFLHTILWEFAKTADARGEHERAQTWRLHVTALKAALEREAWDGAWYRRAYFDDGTPLGSATNAECRIDSIAQTWGVITGAAEPGRGTQAMGAVETHLVRRQDDLVLLLTPPFDRSALEPGYIKGYVPGIRENGGQYTHAAVWVILAFAALGEGGKAAELFEMLNPIKRANSRASVQRYKVEPYVVSGDIYAGAPHTGRGGWTWYTGSAGWLYRAGIEWILGFRLRGMMFRVDPCIPREWPRYSVIFRYHSATYKIRVENPSGVTHGVALTKVDGRVTAGCASIPLADDGIEHDVLVVLG